jgi:two-component system response regulator NreC
MSKTKTSPTPANALASIRIVLADDHPFVREGLRLLIEAQKDMTVVGEASTGEAAWQSAQLLLPDVLIMDLSMPILGGAEATERIMRDCPQVRVLALTVHEEQIYLDRLIGAGASGFMLKRTASADLLNAIRLVASGETYINLTYASRICKEFSQDEQANPDSPSVLSRREHEVLYRIGQGFSNREIAAELKISIKTVETHKARATEKLGLYSRVEIMRYAVRHGWLNE